MESAPPICHLSFTGEPSFAPSGPRAQQGQPSQKGKIHAQISFGGERGGGIAAPAYAAANGPYVGIEGGATFPNSTDLDVILNHGTTTTTYDNGL